MRTQQAAKETRDRVPVRWISRRRIVLLAAAIAALVVDLGYVRIIRAQDGFDPSDDSRVTVFATFVAVAGVLALIAAALPVDVRLPLQAVSATVLLATGFLGMASIGLPLFVAGVLVMAVTTYDAREAHEGALLLTALATVAAVIALAAGIALT